MNWLFAARLRPFVLLAAGASLWVNLASLMPAIYMTQVFDRVFASRSVETLAMLTALTLLALALGYAMDVARSRALAWAGRLLDARLSTPALAGLLRQSAASGRASTDALRDVALLRGVLAGPGIQALFDAPWLPLFLLAIGLMHPALGIAASVGAAVLIALAVLTERLTRDAAEQSTTKARAAAQQAQALTRHAEVIVGMGMGAAAVARWQAMHGESLDAQERLSRHAARLGAAARALRQVLQIALLALGAWLVIGSHASPGVMIAATVLLGRALQPVEQLIAGWKTLVDARAAWARLSATPLASAEETASLELPAPVGRIEVERVVFAPQGVRLPLIKGVGFTLAAGDSLGIVGASGSGKTTLVRLLLGLWKPQSGCVRLDGADIAAWNRDALGTHIGYLPQDVELFAGTVAENIARLGAVDAAKVVEAAQRAHAHEMILRLPAGYDTPIGEAGAVLSGGQRQRIALARALYGSPCLVVLDEPNASLDAEGDAALAAAIAELKTRGVTVVVVGHRAALMGRLDQLAVLKDGALDAFGPAVPLLQRMQRGVAQPATQLMKHSERVQAPASAESERVTSINGARRIQEAIA